MGPCGVNRLKVRLYSKGWFSLATESEFVVGVVKRLANGFNDKVIIGAFLLFLMASPLVKHFEIFPSLEKD